MEEIGTVARTSLTITVSAVRRETIMAYHMANHTLKNESPGPKTMLGRITVASGQISKTDLSASALVLTYGILLFGSDPIALK